MFPFSHIITQHIYLCRALFSQNISMGILLFGPLSAWCERKGKNSTGEQIQMLVSFPAWSHPTRDCCCILTSQHRDHWFTSSSDFIVGWARKRTGVTGKRYVHFHFFLDLYLSGSNSNHETRRGEGLMYTPACSLSSFLAFQSIRNGGGPLYPLHTPLDIGSGVGWWI